MYTHIIETGQTGETKMARFQIGKTYVTRSACDHNCIFSFTILARTAKSVTINVRGKAVRRGLKIWDDVEHFDPFGRYSMAPVISADREAA